MHGSFYNFNTNFRAQGISIGKLKISSIQLIAESVFQTIQHQRASLHSAPPPSEDLKHTKPWIGQRRRESAKPFPFILTKLASRPWNVRDKRSCPSTSPSLCTYVAETGKEKVLEPKNISNVSFKKRPSRGPTFKMREKKEGRKENS